ncbi:MAG: hypothetical protein AAGK05_15170 [Pseudomonadota bacterium]
MMIVDTVLITDIERNQITCISNKQAQINLTKNDFDYAFGEFLLISASDVVLGKQWWTHQFVE